MKRFMLILLSTTFLLTGCHRFLFLLARPSPEGAQTVVINDVTYKTGFYGILYPNNYILTDTILHGDDTDLVKIDLGLNKINDFDLYYSDIGFRGGCTLYCTEDQYDEAFSYYSDPENYYYYCVFGIHSATSFPRSIMIPDIDPDKLEALITFAEEHSYNPFDAKHNESIEKVELPIRDIDENKRISLYKKSNDFLFTSSQGDHYYIWDNTLYLFYQLICGDMEDQLLAVKVPDELGQYFIEYLTPKMDQKQKDTPA